MYEKPRKFFIRMLLLTVLTIFNVVALVLLSAGGTVGVVIALILTLINAVALVTMVVLAIRSLIKYALDKEKKDLGMHILNFLFSLFVTAIFALFYFVIIMGAMIVLLPFLA